MGYPKVKTWSFNLSELDPDSADLEVTLKDQASLPASTAAMISRAQAVFSRIQREAQRGKKGDGIAREDEWALRAPIDMLNEAIVEWNLPYPDDYADKSKRGKVIPLHDVDAEPDPFGQIPTEVYQFILGRVMQRLLSPSKSGPQ